MIMPNRLLDFLSSFGLMAVGAALILFSTISFSTASNFSNKFFPQSGPRRASPSAGPSVLPASRSLEPILTDNTPFTATLTAFSAMVVDDKTGKILFEKNSEAIRPLASITKLAAAMVLLDLPINWSARATTTEADIDSSDHHLKAGEIYRLSDLWKAALVGSSNSAVRILVRSSGLTEEEFVLKMNDKVRSLKLASLSFVDPTGLDARDVGQAGDIIKLLKEAARFDKIRQTLSLSECDIQPLNAKKPRHIWSTDWLLTGWIPNGFERETMLGKTGFINDAGYNFVARLSDEKDNQIFVIALGADSNESRFTEVRDLAKWTFGRYLWPGDEGYPAGE